MALPNPEKYAKTVGFSVVRDQFPQMKIEAMDRHPRRVRTHTLSWEKATKAEVDQAHAQLDAVKGMSGVFQYTPIDEGSAVDVRFDSDSIDEVEVEAGTYQMTIRLIEEIFT
jgi:hypothetical protein